MSTFREKLDSVVAHHDLLSQKLSSPDLSTEEMIKLSKEYSGMNDAVAIIREYQAAMNEIDDLQELLDDESTSKDMYEMAYEERAALKEKIPDLEERIQLALLPKDEADSKNAILEVRAGTGGDEAALFAADLFNMYQRYASLQGWKFEIMEIATNDIGGYREATANISGDSVFARMKFESGVHRVQRVPKTETQGRVHTSAATVAVLPEAEEVDVKMEEKDLRIDVFRASGPGGQSVNTTDSAVRITHIPTGIVVSQQDEKSQHKNKAKALKILRSRIYDAERQRQMDERASARKTQIGSGDRSERIRTYNYPQSRVTDHRINLTSHNLNAIVAGDALDEIIDPLISEEQAEKMAEAV